MHRHEDGALPDARRYSRTCDDFAVRALDARQPCRLDTRFARVDGVDLDERLSDVGHQPGRFSGSRHRVPLVADAAGVQDEWKCRTDGGRRGAIGRRHEPRAIVGRVELAIREEARLASLGAGEQAIAIRMIHACGMTDIVDDLVISAGFVSAAGMALAAARPVFVDAEMVRHGIIARNLKAKNEVICTLNDPQAREIGLAQGITRSAAAVDLWLPSLAGAIAIIGNAPTALFHLLEKLDNGAAKPAAIVGLPVGFVGAAESKEELATNSRGVPFITLKGRRGGSAMASAVINALAGDM